MITNIRKEEYLKSNITCTKDIPVKFIEQTWKNFNLDSINKRD